MKSNKPESLDNSIEEKPETKAVTEVYTDIYTLSKWPISEVALEKLANDLVEWATNNEDALRITQFIRAKKLYQATFYRWVDKYPFLKEAHKIAMEAIGDRREIGAIKNKYNSSAIFRTQHRYNKEWWDDEVKRAELRARTTNPQNQDIKYTVVLDSYKEKDEPEK